jgi:lysophospholipase L1-like esterase
VQPKQYRPALRWTIALLLGLNAGFRTSSASFLSAAENPRWEFLRANLDVFPGMEKIFEPDVKLFWKLKPNLQNVRAAEKLPDAEYPFTISTDRFGRRTMPQLKQSRHTVLFLGDSCTFGIPVNGGETYPALLQQRLKQVRCINAGVPGYSAYQGRLVLEQWDPTQKPDAVVITFWPNDRSVWDHLSDAEHAELIADEAAGTMSSLRLTRLLRRALPSSRPRLTGQEFEQEIREILRWCRQRGVVPILQVWPAKRQMESPQGIDRQQVLRRIAAQESVLLVDLVPLVRAQRRPSLFSDAIHMLKDGHALVAAALQPLVEQALARAAAKPEAAAQGDAAGAAP